MKNRWQKKLKEKFGEKCFLETKMLKKYGGDSWSAFSLPEAVILPETQEEVSEVMQIASEFNIPLTSRGMGTGYVGSCVPSQGGIVLSTEKMNQILEISPSDGIAIVQPGLITADLKKAVLKEGLEYPPDPASISECSIGGNVATNAGGPRCLKYGVTENYVIGLKVVLSNGEILECGSKTRKNVTGLNLCSLFVGSEGTLGIITEITLSLIPKIEARGIIIASFDELHLATKSAEKILCHSVFPSALEIVDEFTLNVARKKGGKRILPKGEALLMIEVDGLKNSIPQQIESIKTLLHQCKANFLHHTNKEQEVENLWQIRREFSYALRDTGLLKINQDITVPRGKVGEMIKISQKISKEFQIPIACFGHLGDGNLHINLMLKKPEIEKQKSEKAVAKLFEKALELGGVLSGEHGIGLAKKQWMNKAISSTSFSLQTKIKQVFDPKGILNPNKFPEKQKSEQA